MKEVLIKENPGAKKESFSHPVFTQKAFLDMTLKRIPDFEPLYENLLETDIPEGGPLSAIYFLDALRKFRLSKEEIGQILNNPEGKHILAENELIKIVLIRWAPGDMAGIHGHAKGGCVLKVLHGEIAERRYSTDDKSLMLSQSRYFKDHIAYIDDVMGLHDVENNSGKYAISLHLYTPGIK